MSPNTQQLTDVVFLHGINNSPLSWAGVTECLPGYRTTVPLLPATADVDALASSLIDSLPERFVLVGHSFGGYVALSLLEQFPERITGFVMVNSIDSADTSVMAAGRREKAQQALDGAYEALAEAATSVSYHQNNLADEALMSRRTEAISEYGVNRFSAHQEASAIRPDRSSVLRETNVPKLVIAAEEDRVILTSKQASMAEAAGAKFITVADGGHMLPAEQPAAVAEILDTWVQQLGCSGCRSKTNSGALCSSQSSRSISKA